MDSQREAEGKATRVIYTCWPFGDFLCGAATAGVGLAVADPTPCYAQAEGYSVRNSLTRTRIQPLNFI